jgi:hypothetical protein
VAGWVAGLALAPVTLAGAAPSVQLRAAKAPTSQLTPAGSTRAAGGVIVYRYQQQIGGVDVFGAEAVVNDAPGSPPQLVADATTPTLTAATSPRVSRSGALAIAAHEVHARRLRAAPGAQLVVLPSGGGRLAWRAVIPAARPLGDFEVMVDASSGRPIRIRNLLQRATGAARLYNPNPVAQQGSDTGLTDHQDADSGLLASLRLPVSLLGIADGQDCLKGTYVNALLHPRGRPVCRASLNWSRAERSKDRFEALMAYYHVDRTQRYIQDLGFANVDNRRQRVVADAFSADNSFYSPWAKDIEYGAGGVDDAEDADVIIHEYGHSIQDDQDPGFGIGNQAGAIGEGWGDYLSATMTYQSPGLPDYPDAAACIFDWDGVSWGKAEPTLGGLICGRHANDTRTLPQARGEGPGACANQEIHCVGQVWSSALLDLRGTLGLDGNGHSILDRDVIQSQFDYTDSESFAEAVDALLDADATLYGGADRVPICQEMAVERLIIGTSCP